LIAQINNLQQQVNQIQAQKQASTLPQQQVPNQASSQAPSQQIQPQASQTLLGLSQQQKMTLDDIANEITSIRIALSSMELAIKKLKQ
jgi:hypothetical protein